MKKALYLIALPLIGVMLYYVFGTNTQNYKTTIEEARQKRIHFLTNSASSPVLNKETFKHDGFFEIDEEYHVHAKVKINPKTQMFSIPFSTGKLETYLHYADVTFKLKNKERHLVMFQNFENNAEFIIPFSDLTNGKTTYGAGRYLPVQYLGGEHIQLDFNLADSPYCAFNENFSCPLPPKQNHLDLEIIAGEKSNTSLH